MRPGLDRRYSDRDVRDNPDLLEVALDYLDGYTGEFDFLLGMQMRVSQGLSLSTGMVRGVLNCMRNDPRADLPEVEDDGVDDVDEEDNVVDLAKARWQVFQRPRRREPAPEPPAEPPCPLEGREHDAHWKHRGGSGWWCRGWHALHRQPFVTKRARFHADYVRGAKSNLIHRATHEGWIVWANPPHRWGMARVWSWEVGRVCSKNAYPLKRGETLTAQQVREAEPHEVHHTNPHKGITLCALCFPNEEGKPTPL